MIGHWVWVNFKSGKSTSGVLKRLDAAGIIMFYPNPHANLCKTKFYPMDTVESVSDQGRYNGGF